MYSLLQNEAGISRNKALTGVKFFINEMANALANGDRVEIRGLCSFCVKNYNTYAGRKLKICEKVNIKPKKLPIFKFGKDLKEKVQ